MAEIYNGDSKLYYSAKEFNERIKENIPQLELSSGNPELSPPVKLKYLTKNHSELTFRINNSGITQVFINGRRDEVRDLVRIIRNF